MMKSCYTKILFLVQVLWKVNSIEGQVYFESVGGFTFDHVEPDWLSVPATGIGITYMDHDQYIPGNILYTESHSIKTLNPQTNETTVIAGSERTRGYRERNGPDARFQSPFSFYQMNATSVIIADTQNHCFRMLSRLSNETSLLAGLCTISGNRAGTFPLARFNEPYKLVEVEPGVLAFTDSLNGNIKKLDCNNAEVTLLAQFNHTVFALAIRPGTRDLYFSFHGGFGSVDLETFETIEYETQTVYNGYRDGALRNHAVFTARPEALLFLSKDVMLVAGLSTHLIRVVNFVNEFVSSICDPEPEGNTTRSGDIETCQLSYPRSLLALREEERVLIGFHESIGYMGVSGLSRITTSTTAGPTTTTTTTLTPAATTPTTTTPTTTTPTTTKPTTTTPTATTPTTTTPSTPQIAQSSTPTAISTLLPKDNSDRSTVQGPTTSNSGTQGTTTLNKAQQSTEALLHADRLSALSPELVKIVGIAVGGLSFMVLLIIGGVCCKRNYNKRRQESDYVARPLSGPYEDHDLIIYDEIDTRKVCSTYEIPVGKSPTPPPPRASNDYEDPQKTITTTLPKVLSVPLFDAPEPPMEMSDLSESFKNKAYGMGPVGEELRDSSYMECL